MRQASEDVAWQMKIHQVVCIDLAHLLRVRITRVPGGWIYQYIESEQVAINNTMPKETIIPPVFVPYCEQESFKNNQ